MPYDMQSKKHCWTWDGSHSGTDGRPVLNGKLAYRLMYEKLRGPIPKGMVAHHTCKNPQCVNPWHIELMSNAEHMRLHSPEYINWQSLKTHCKRGHEFTEASTYHTASGGRACKICRLQWARADRIRRGIKPGRKGEANGQAKLTDMAVKNIKSIKHWSPGLQAKLAHKYGVSTTAIGYVRDGTTWKHI
jgi:hypothetical protein